jgi:hypothetical protein
MIVGPLVDDQQVEMLQTWLLQQLNAHTGPERFKLTLIINANRGSYPACLALYDFLRSLEDGVELYVITQGVVNGPVALIPLAADYEHRFMAPYTVFQVGFPKVSGHCGKFSLESDGPIDSDGYLKAQRDQAEKHRVDDLPVLYSLRDAAAIILAERLSGKLSYEEACQLLRDFRAYDGERAIEAGFACDSVPRFVLPQPDAPQTPTTAEQNMRLGYL